MTWKMNNLFILLIFVCYLIIDSAGTILSNFGFYSELNKWIKYTAGYSLQIVLTFLFAAALIKFFKLEISSLSSLGLDKNLLKGLYTSIVFTLPMLIGYFLIAPLNANTSPLDILFWAFLSGSVEELVFRGFLFGFLFRFAKIGFLTSILIVSLLFAAGHLYQGSDLMSTLGVAGVTFFGGLIFGWLYIEWDNNLWIPIGTHILMNLYWMIFDIGASNALGGLGANIFRFTVILLLLTLTLKKIKKEGSKIKGKWFSLSYLKQS